jgi:AraC-like DNA-binding protein
MRAMATRGRTTDRVRYRQPRRGIETLQAFFAGHAFDRHAHDTLAVGQTDSGVQRFRYRGRQHDSTPGGMIVLHPGEAHDGECGGGAGFAYRIIYLDPGYGSELLREAGLGPHLPFAAEPVLFDTRLQHAFGLLWTALDEGAAGECLGQDEGVVALWRALAGDRAHLRSAAPDRLRLARDALADAPERSWSLDELAALAGLSRFALCRAFRQACGVSPHAWLLERRLTLARVHLAAGMPAAEAALAAGFADQSHLTRHLKRRFGMAPGRFARVIGRTEIA